MKTPHLYDHRFDIDDLIAALCGTEDVSRFCLNSKEGTLRTLPEGERVTEESHTHSIEALPDSFLDEMRGHYTLRTLPEGQRSEVMQILETISHLYELPAYFEKGMTGGWLRERIKEAALEWLDARDMIPPSMRHVRDTSMFTAPAAKVSIV